MLNVTSSPRMSQRRIARLCTLVSFAVSCGAGEGFENNELLDTEDSEIIGGSVAAVGAWPFQAQIAVPGFSHYCGGSLLSTEWVLTAAHCVDGHVAADFTVTLGEHDRSITDGAEQVRTVSTVVKHPLYPGPPNFNDIAVLRLSSPVLLNDRVRTIRPASAGDGSGQNSIVSGWGYTVGSPSSASFSTLLMQATLPIATNASCAAALGVDGDLQADELCAGFADGASGACYADSGGPLSVERFPGYREVVGIVSWGSQFCNTYGVFARVSSHFAWVRSHVFDSAILPGLVMPLT